MARVHSLVLLAMALVLLATPGCKKTGATTGGKPVVAASIFPIYDLVRRVGGDAVDAKLLLDPGRSAHSYNPTPKQVKAVSGAKVAFLVGLELDDWAAKVFEATGGKTKIVRLGTTVEAKPFNALIVGGGEGEGHEDEDGKDHRERDQGDEHAKGHDDHGDERAKKHGDDDGKHAKEHDDEHGDHPLAHHHPKGLDPHVWLSVKNAVALVAAIRSELVAAVPEKKAVFEANAAKLTKELDGLHRETQSAIAKLPNKSIVTFHGSFGYFASEYGLTIVAVIEPFPGKQPSAKYLHEVVTTVKSKKVKALFTEPQLARRPAEVVAKEANLKLSTLDPVGGLEGRDSYAALMRFNTKALQESLR